MVYCKTTYHRLILFVQYPTKIMKRSSAELKALARGILQGRYTLAVELVLACFVLISALSWININFFPLLEGYSFINMLGNFMVSLLSVMVSAGLSYCFLAMSRGRQVQISDLFFAFRYQSDKALILSLIYSIVMTLLEIPMSLLSTISIVWGGYLENHLFLLLALIFTTVACVILMIIFALSFSMCYYIYIDHPELDTRQIIQASFQMIKGNRVRLFYLYVSFIGLFILSALTCFIGLLWIIPYIKTTSALFYRELNRELPPKMDTVEF